MNSPVADESTEVRDADPSTRGFDTSPVALLRARQPSAWAERNCASSRREDLRVDPLRPDRRHTSYPTRRSASSTRSPHSSTRFGYTPDGKPTILLQDFSDRGNATAMSTPRNRIYLDIAPPTLAFETFSPGERLFTMANHEVGAPGDLRSGEPGRHAVSAHCSAARSHRPPSIPSRSSTTTSRAPRNTAPRWYFEGSAVFMETWLGGGYGRAQGGYDEMMFRAMVRDDARFYDPLGLVSIGHRGRLPGWRERLPVRHAVHELPGDRVWAGEAPRLVAARRRIAAFLLGRLPARVRHRARPGLAELDRLGARIPDEEPGRGARAPGDALSQRHATVGLGALSRAVASDDGRTLYAAVRYPGPHPAPRLDLARGRFRHRARRR